MFGRIRALGDGGVLGFKDDGKAEDEAGRVVSAWESGVKSENMLVHKLRVR